ncbi:MAG: family 1 glycosylhydrolase, partial [Clostridium celatum]|nr:family 1 glycosylhydrolase [Clostridium celatum]
NAFKNRYGFVSVDLMDGYKRKKKKSAAWIAKVAETKIVE